VAGAKGEEREGKGRKGRERGGKGEKGEEREGNGRNYWREQSANNYPFFLPFRRMPHRLHFEPRSI